MISVSSDRRFQRPRITNTESVLGNISLTYTTFANEEDVIRTNPIQRDCNLMSPQKQRLYLAGLLMSTEYSGKPPVYNENLKDFRTLENDIQDITSDYIKGFLSFDKETFDPSKDDSKEELKKCQVSLEAFVSYFDTGILRYDEQTVDLIHTLYGPFDRELLNLTGLSVADFVMFYEFVKKKILSRYKDANAAIDRVNSIIEEYDKSSSDKERQAVYRKLHSYALDHPDEVNGIRNGMTGFNKISKDEISGEFGREKGELLIKLFSLKREERPFQFYNQRNPFVERPLCWLDEEKLFLVSPTLLLSSVFSYISNVIENENNSFYPKYVEKKAGIVEAEFLNCFHEIFGETANYYSSVCEIPGSFEHDILVEYGNTIIIAEVKASKVHEPFFNPEKAYTRLERHFFSKNGIGYAYNQAINLKKALEATDSITLYEKMKNPFVIEGLNTKEIIPVVLTLNQFGAIAINTSLLLTPDENQPYPWVCNLHDFQNLIEIMKYLHKNVNDFLSYIRWRCKMHEKTIAGDELDIAEFFFTGSKYSNEKDYIIIDNNTENCLIDKIYFEKHGLKMPNASQAYISERIVSSPPIIKQKKIYPNDPCPCGSGKKYKKCHGKGF